VRRGRTLTEAELGTAVAAAGLKLESVTPPSGGAPGTCVVSGKPLGPAPVDIEHAGRKVRLCCADCIAAFRADPERFLAGLK